MPSTFRALAGIAALLLASPAIDAQGVVMERNVSLGMAKTIAEAALAACKDKGYHVSIAVVDRAGQVMVILRDEQAAAQTTEMARRKAYTARMFRTTTLEFQKRTMDPAFAPQRNVADILALGGGVPIAYGKEIIGGVGSSGSSQEQDDACAKAGVAAVAEQLKPSGQ
ncbi:MAG TPA: heme-binding protein [Bryobacteraceae bacterium]|nr:heme-binding protein [Bryobacteraceae bacterium]